MHLSNEILPAGEGGGAICRGGGLTKIHKRSPSFIFLCPLSIPVSQWMETVSQTHRSAKKTRV